MKIHRHKCCSVVATCVSGCGVRTECRAARCPALKCNFSKAERNFPEDNPDESKHVGANIETF